MHTHKQQQHGRESSSAAMLHSEHAFECAYKHILCTRAAQLLCLPRTALPGAEATCKQQAVISYIATHIKAVIDINDSSPLSNTPHPSLTP
jgi:hypothetical protein